MESITLQRLMDKMKLTNLTPEIDISDIKITQPDINRPALQIAGYFEHYEATRLQIIGFVEYTYMEGMSEDKKEEVFDQLLNHPTPCIVFCRDLIPDPIFLEKAKKYGVPYLRIYGRGYPMVKCKTGALHYRSWGFGGCVW